MGHAWAVVDQVQSDHGILAYFRFRGDLLIAVEGTRPEEYKALLEGMFDRAGRVAYAVKVEFVDTSVPFLNVRVG